MGLLDGFFTTGEVSELATRAVEALERLAAAVEKIEHNSTRDHLKQATAQRQADDGAAYRCAWCGRPKQFCLSSPCTGRRAAMDRYRVDDPASAEAWERA